MIQRTISTALNSLKMYLNEIYLFQNSPVQPLSMQFIAATTITCSQPSSRSLSYSLEGSNQCPPTSISSKIAVSVPTMTIDNNMRELQSLRNMSSAIGQWRGPHPTPLPPHPLSPPCNVNRHPHQVSLANARRAGEEEGPMPSWEQPLGLA